MTCRYVPYSDFVMNRLSMAAVTMPTLSDINPARVSHDACTVRLLPVFSFAVRSVVSRFGRSGKLFVSGIQTNLNIQLVYLKGSNISVTLSCFYISILYRRARRYHPTAR